MPLIQRNLFPSRPPSKKCDGPSVLRAANNINNNHNNNSMNNNHDSINNRTIINPNLSGRTKVKISYDSQDSFNTSSDTR
ncbi:hypothetical protein DERF_003936 [Dermatophagoides farinae]|uniref:Uncharacterized protein n=1 Tax=Dermatophagoides farinae TaxID=6954 RepID=A0A922IFU3_DERFA|nr:hypothetical protein DERF_003936 [Dermatophagoides farinae]